MWPIKKQPVPCRWLDFEPETVLDEYDGPMLFTLRDAAANKYLAFFCDRDANGVRFLVVPFSDNLELRLVGGDIDLREALLRPRMWVFDLDKKWEPVRCWPVAVGDLPHNLLPNPGVMLRAYMRPVTKQALVQSITHGTVLTRRFGPSPSAAGA